MEKMDASWFKEDKDGLNTDGFLGNTVTHYKKVEQLKNKKQQLQVQKLSKHARKRARAEKREVVEIIPRRYQKPFHKRTEWEIERDMCHSEYDSDEECW